MAMQDFVQPFPVHQTVRHQCARPPFTHRYIIVPVSRAMNHHTQLPPALTTRPPSTRDALQSSFSAPSLDGSHYHMTPPSEVAGDLATIGSCFPWRQYGVDDSFAAPTTDLVGYPYQSMSTNPFDQATWPLTAENQSVPTLDNLRARPSTSGSVVTPEIQNHCGHGGRSDVKFGNMDVGQSALLATECDNAPSPSTTDTYSNDPRTPGSSRHSDGVGRWQHDRAHENIFCEQAVPKFDTSFGTLPSDHSMSAAIPSHAPAFHSASFGDMTLAAALQTQSGQWPTVPMPMPTCGAYHPHGHGLPSGIPDPASTYIDLQSVQPFLAPDVAHGPDEAHGEDGSESYSERGSEVKLEDDVQEDLNDRALHDAHARRARDKFLLKMRSEGFSYKAIKRMGNFREAESTLRGRVRVLTKDKAERVRRPEWTVEDAWLLREAVARFSSQHDLGRGRDSGRLPWKKISDYLKQEGVSYPFAAATCARKWKDLGTK
ncbi:hypothetical protein CERZMDRAFT_98504 [Cercospora zeae-maydis SCOH1-5]|uniref:Myb-like domain-containing protein n=1 Tax=Cercospora zeae-maydis SCOH1-5 TaxID=717836 RepID=A0A6A6FE38_9PEZI|nr:hypothetical protein CERZMDRAFT_98504 [Cercospora zeae-maydis SCOH1-5]